MNSPLDGAPFLFMWLGFLGLMIGCVAAFFLWAVRDGQFSQQDRARYLPLQSGIPAADGSDQETGQQPAGDQPHDA